MEIKECVVLFKTSELLNELLVVLYNLGYTNLPEDLTDIRYHIILRSDYKVYWIPEIRTMWKAIDFAKSKKINYLELENFYLYKDKLGLLFGANIYEKN
jgi:hypothetical protein